MSSESVFELGPTSSFLSILILYYCGLSRHLPRLRWRQVLSSLPSSMFSDDFF